jgi:predicted metalloprotease with PDZ domain
MAKTALKPSPRPAVSYRVAVADLHGHRFAITLTIAQPAPEQQVSLPVWIPGSYLVREFSKNLLQLTAAQGDSGLAVQQRDKCTWLIACDPAQPLVLHYEVYAFDNSVRTAWLDAARGFFNGTSLCLAVAGHTNGVHELTLVSSKSTAAWSIATGLSAHKVNKNGFGSYRAANYDELVDCPVEMGHFWLGTFKACGVPHRFAVAGAPPSFDGSRLLADTQRICEAEIRFWHPSKKGTAKPAHQDYLFMLNAVDDGYGGLEHRNSTALICTRRDLPRLATETTLNAKQPDGGVKQPDGYATLLGLISHEYFHTWNVKRLCPAEFVPYRYDQENYTELLWFFEGFTSYYDDLLLRRAGLLDDAGYLKLLAKTVNQVMQAPGRAIHSVAQSSFEAWTKYYRVDENTPNATVSYYTKGALVALCFDLTLRLESAATLDDAMRLLWLRCCNGKDNGEASGPMTQADFAAVLQTLSGRSFAPELAAWVHGTQDLPWQDLLQRHGVQVIEESAALAQQLGLRLGEAGGVVSIKTVLRGGLAEQAGFATGDEWLGVDDWRLGKLDDLPLLTGTATEVSALVSRDKRLMRLRLTLPHTGSSGSAGAANASRSSWRLGVQDAARVGAWLGA